MSILIGPRLLHVNLFCAIFFFSSTQCVKAPSRQRWLAPFSSLFVRPMAETLLATEQRELRMRCGAHRSVSLPLQMTSAVNGRQYGLAVPTHTRRARLFDTLWAFAADSATG